MFVFYLLSLAFAAGLVGSLVRSLLADIGFVPGVAASLYVTFAVALAYVALQLAVMAAIRMYQPTRTQTTLATEAVSNLAAIVLLGAWFGSAIPVPSERLRPLLPLAFLGAFAGIHTFLKLATFYAALRGAKDPERPILVWLGSSLGAFLLAGGLLLAWINQAEAARGVVTGDTAWIAAGDQYAHARIANEGAVLSGDIPPNRFGGLALRFAPIPSSPVDLDRVYATISIDGTETKVYEAADRLYADAWSEILVPADALPTDPRRYSVRWTREEEPNWVRLLGLRPVVYGEPAAEGGDPVLASLYLSGPAPYAARENLEGQNVVVVMIDGLGANHLSFYGYPRDVTPAIDRLAYGASSFPNTYVPAKDTETALRALVTGSDPAKLGGSAWSDPALLNALRDAGYALAAFVESTGEEAFPTSTWSTGFEFFDSTIGGVASGEGAATPTTARATEWIRRHREVPFFCLVRLRRLADLDALPETGEDFAAPDGTSRDVDAYDSALADLDRLVGALISYVRDHETRNNTVIVITAPYGHEFTPGSSGKAMGLTSDRVPLLVFVPGRRPRTVPERATMHDLGVTIAGLAKVRMRASVDGIDLLN